jgi:hypothetical protein
MITAFGLAALLLTPFTLFYSCWKLRADAAQSRWWLLVLGSLSAAQSVATLVYFVMLFRMMGDYGLGV